MKLSTDELKYVLALLLVPKIGPVLAKNLIAYCGSAQKVFSHKKQFLQKIPGIGKVLAENISVFNDFERADKEIEFMQKHNIKPLYFLDEDYPQRLKDIVDAPLVLYYKGNANLNTARVLGIVGTRKATDYGKAQTERLIEELAAYNVLVISGLAYGIDAVAHKMALKYNLPTVGVLGHGLQTIYPPAHRNLAVQMLENGGILTEFISGTKPDRENFPSRNRLVAGMVDGVLLVETAINGGALITGEIAYSYNREVFAVPGRLNDEFSAGCNYFIKTQRAVLTESAADIAYHLGWDLDNISKPKNRKKDYSGLSEPEQQIVQILQENEKLDIDNLCKMVEANVSEVSMLLLELEFKGVVQALPAKFFRLA